jgi:hypothetical protein
VVFTQNFPGGASIDGGFNYVAQWFNTGDSARQSISFPNGNVDLSGNRRLRIASINPLNVAGTNDIRINFNGTDYAAGNTIGDTSPSSSAQVRIYKTGGSQSNVNRDNNGTSGAMTLHNSGGTATFTWNGRMKGTFTWGTVPTTPGLTLSSVVGTTVTLSTGASSSDGGYSISSYSYQRRENGGSWTGTQTFTSRPGSVTFSGLNPGSTYDFRAYATNTVGSSTARQVSGVDISAYGRVRRSGAWQTITTGRVYRAGAWRNITTARVYRSGAWRDINNA